MTLDYMGWFITFFALLGWITRPTKTKYIPQMGSVSEPRSYIFKNAYLLHHSDDEGFILPHTCTRERAWETLSQRLEQIIPGCALAMKDLTTSGMPFRMSGPLGEDEVHVIGAISNDSIHISVSGSRQDQSVLKLDKSALNGIEHELTWLRETSDNSPMLAWRVDHKGLVTWANQAYRDEINARLGQDASTRWPLPPLFSTETTLTVGKVRRTLPSKPLQAKEEWYDVTVRETREQGFLIHAMPINDVVAAEDRLENLIQTLTKTFAHMPNGLAIFDTEHRLTLFNPEFASLSALDPVWLLKKPDLSDVLDRLRDLGTGPSTTDFKGWKRKFTDMTHPNRAGNIEEIWTLPTGQTLRVMGRPHEDGALALEFTDITQELVNKRAQREEIAFLRSVFQNLEHACLFMNIEGTIRFANPAAQQIFSTETNLRQHIMHHIQTSQKDEPLTTAQGTYTISVTPASGQYHCITLLPPPDLPSTHLRNTQQMDAHLA